MRLYCLLLLFLFTLFTGCSIRKKSQTMIQGKSVTIQEIKEEVKAKDSVVKTIIEESKAEEKKEDTSVTKTYIFARPVTLDEIEAGTAPIKSVSIAQQGGRTAIKKEKRTKAREERKNAVTGATEAKNDTKQDISIQHKAKEKKKAPGIFSWALMILLVIMAVILIVLWRHRKKLRLF